MYPFKPGSFAPRNAWYVAAFANAVGRELVERTIVNTPVVLYRKEDGTPVALDGRCPHRHFPLGRAACMVTPLFAAITASLLARTGSA